MQAIPVGNLCRICLPEPDVSLVWIAWNVSNRLNIFTGYRFGFALIHYLLIKACR
jgi:hypothetical protein